MQYWRMTLTSPPLSPVPELSFLTAPCRGWIRAGEKRVQDNLHAHAQNEPIKNYWSQPRCSRQCVTQCLFQLALWKKILWRWYCGKKQIEMWFIVVCALIDNEYASLLFSWSFLYCFCMLSEFAKVFERKVWRVQEGHLHNAAHALLSLSRCFQLKYWQRFLSLSLILW